MSPAWTPTSTFPSYEVGTDVDLYGEWSSQIGKEDPEQIALEVTEPDGTKTTKTKTDFTKESDGVWYYRFTTDQVGLHVFTIVATASDSSTVSQTGYFRVRDLNL